MMEGEEGEVSSECISGSQSGWTSYLNHSSCDSPHLLVHNNGGSFHHAEEQDEEEEEEEEEEDLSMVSDASSKPPHFLVEDEHCNCSSLTPPSQWVDNGGKKKRRLEPNQQKKERHFTSLLDDTASSPLFTLHSKDMKPPIMEEEGVLEFSCAFSATHFKRNQALEKQMDYLNPQRNQQDQYQGKEGRRNGE